MGIPCGILRRCFFLLNHSLGFVVGGGSVSGGGPFPSKKKIREIYLRTVPTFVTAHIRSAHLEILGFPVRGAY